MHPEQVHVLSKAPRDIARILGADYAHRPREGLSRVVLRLRLKRAKSLAARLAQLWKAGWRVQFMTPAPLRPMAMYGTHVTGISTAHIHEFRKCYSMAMSSRQRHSITMDMAFDKGVHPAVPERTDVILMWCACPLGSCFASRDARTQWHDI